MARFRKGLLSAVDATGELHLSRSRFYVLYADFLRACAQRRQRSWVPGSSGGNHHPAWSADVCDLLRKLLRARPPASYSFAASEVHRRHQLKLDRASVRRWALAQGLAPDARHKAPRKPVRRWQVQQVGQLWQYDASPHRWFGEDHPALHLIEIIDDHSRVVPLARLYPRESLLAHLDFLSSAFAACGLPLALYVDYHSFFFTHAPDAFTQLGAALRFYEVSLRYAPTPQAKGKIERLHDFWQKRLPSVFAAEAITTLGPANALIDELRCIATNRKNIARSAPLRGQHGSSHSARSARLCVPLQPARGGLTSGVSAPAHASIQTAVSPSAPHACASTGHPVQKSSAAFIQTVTSPSSQLLPPRIPGPFSSSTPQLPRLSCFDRTLLSCFEILTTWTATRIDFLDGIFH